jgi:CRISPR/Cas system-associated protein Cas5 (RAMP superfamily)
MTMTKPLLGKALGSDEGYVNFSNVIEGFLSILNSQIIPNYYVPNALCTV